jgi:hypothetical protein
MKRLTPGREFLREIGAMNNEDQAMQILAERIARLERQNRHMKHAGLMLLFMLTAIFLMAQVKPAAKIPAVKAVKSLEAGKFILQDGLGKKRAELTLVGDRPSLIFYDEADHALISAGLEPEGAGLTLYDTASREVAAIHATATGPVFSLYHSGMKRLNLSVTAQGPALGLVGRNNEAKAALGLTADDSAFLHLFGPGERGGVQMLASVDRTVLRFFDLTDKARTVLGILGKEGAPGFVLNDDAGTARSILMLGADGPAFEFFDKNRVRTWTAR